MVVAPHRPPPHEPECRIELAPNRSTTSRGTRMSLVVFARHWVRVKLRGPQGSQRVNRLVFESQGRTCEVGRFLIEEERRDLPSRLPRVVGRTSESPALGS
jgi:uncharacterized membrane protein